MDALFYFIYIHHRHCLTLERLPVKYSNIFTPELFLKDTDEFIFFKTAPK